MHQGSALTENQQSLPNSKASFYQDTNQTRWLFKWENLDLMAIPVHRNNLLVSWIVHILLSNKGEERIYKAMKATPKQNCMTKF